MERKTVRPLTHSNCHTKNSRPRCCGISRVASSRSIRRRLANGQWPPRCTCCNTRPLRIGEGPQSFAEPQRVEAPIAATDTQAKVWTALAWRLAVKHRARVAIFTLPPVTTHCWPSELLEALAQDLAPPSRQEVRHWSLLIAPRHWHRATRTGVFSDSLLLDSPHRALLNPALKVFQRNGSNDPLWTFTNLDLPAALAETASELQVPVTAHQARRRRAIDRLGLEATRHNISSEARPLGGHKLGRVVRATRATGIGVRQTPRRSTNTLQHMSNESRISSSAVARRYTCLTAWFAERPLLRNHQRSGWRWKEGCFSRGSCAHL